MADDPLDFLNDLDARTPRPGPPMPPPLPPPPPLLATPVPDDPLGFLEGQYDLPSQTSGGMTRPLTLQQQRQQWLLRMASLIRAEELCPLAISVYQHLLAIDARLRIGFETNVFPAAALCDLLGASLVNLEQLAAQGSCPAFSEVAKTAHNLYREIVRLMRTFPQQRPYLIGGGFGIRGAVKGIAVATGINWMLNHPTRQRQSHAAQSLAENVQNAHVLLQLLRDRCGAVSNP